MKIDKNIIKELSDYLDEFNLTEIEYTEKDVKVKVSKSKSVSTSVISSSGSDKKNITVNNNDEVSESGTKITSPIIGTAYLAAEPGGKKFTDVGRKIKKGDTIMIVEAMKTMNHVPSTNDGIVKSILVKDGQPVEFGQTLVILK